MGDGGERKYEILLIEDNPADAVLLRQRLKECEGSAKDCNVRWLKNCAEVIPFLRSREMAGYKPDLIILDYRMPMNGGRALVDLKSHPDYLHIPVVVLTGSLSPRDVYEVYSRGANCCYHKPCDLYELDLLIQMLTDHWLTKICAPNASSP